MSFEQEFKLIAAFVLIFIPFNPTNIFTDFLLVSIIDTIFPTSGMFGWISIALPLAIKLLLAVGEIEILATAYHKWFGKNGKK